MFVDYLTVMMVAVVAGAVLTIAYGLTFLEARRGEHAPDLAGSRRSATPASYPRAGYPVTVASKHSKGG